MNESKDGVCSNFVNQHASLFLIKTLITMYFDIGDRQLITQLHSIWKDKCTCVYVDIQQEGNEHDENLGSSEDISD